MSKDQNGFISIIAATIIMVLVSLIVIGFSVLMQREQRQALDRQLSTQAYYAAETAVNDTDKLIKDGLLTADLIKDECDVSGPIWGPLYNNGVIADDGATDNDDSVRYTCVRYNQTPTDLLFTDKITTNRSKIFPIESADGTNITSIRFKWTSDKYNGNLDASGNDNIICDPNQALPGQFAANTVPMLRVDLIAVPTVFDRETLSNNTANFYLFPKSTCGQSVSSPVSYSNYIKNGSPNNAPVSSPLVLVDCDSTGCELQIDMPNNGSRYYARVKSVYQNVGSLNITASNTAGEIEFKNAQTVVDATGRANDVLRRIEVRISDADYAVPETVLEAGDGFCKELLVVPPSTLIGDANCYN